LASEKKEQITFYLFLFAAVDLSNHNLVGPLSVMIQTLNLPWFILPKESDQLLQRNEQGVVLIVGSSPCLYNKQSTSHTHRLKISCIIVNYTKEIKVNIYKNKPDMKN
jgi:hypothetical protein